MQLQDADIPALVQRAGLDAEGFGEQLHRLKLHVRMDVLERTGGVGEVVYELSDTWALRAAAGRSPR
ncbi:hypothetical protein ACFW4X_20155 [Streptomyces smyrnaeus]|uniref:hypothetical protein n=1 Tax=Streptomyces smyrnaeus TaxID=1387713 RepID=UPI0036870604